MKFGLFIFIISNILENFEQKKTEGTPTSEVSLRSH